MNGRPLTDVRVSQALRAHLPQSAPAGLRELIVDAAESTTQQRALPLFLGALTEADPVARRRSMLIAAVLLLAVAVASAAAVGAWRLLQRDPIDELSLEPPADVPAFVLSSYERLPQLPPLALTWHDSGSAMGRIYVDRSGAVRFDRFASADATEPASYRILSPDHRISGMAPVDDEAVWIDPGHEAIGEDPRVFLRTVLRAEEGPGCEMERDPGEVGNGSAAAGWRYVGLEYVVGRPTHHVACAGDLWIDIETRLILRTQGPAVDDAGQPIPVEFTEVIEIAFGEQPAALFEPPEGVTRMSAEEYSAYICARDLPNEMALGISDCPSTEEAEATPPPESSPTPMPTVRPNTSDCAVPPGDPSEPIGPLAWTPESLNEDWPAPVRPEPAGGRSVQPMPLTYLDLMGDNGSDAYPCVDIRGVMADTSEVNLELVSKPPPWSCSESRVCVGVDPTAQWIAYGVVTDEDGDGVPDWRYGIDNMPADAAESGPPRRGWRTNLHTGQTEAGPEHGDPVWLNGGGFKSGLPPESAGFWPDAIFLFGGAFDTTQGSQGWGFELDMPFYTWASVIVNGRVVATDYAPDAGWLVATPGAKPGGTYLLGDPLPQLSMTVPDGWTGDAGGLRRTCGDDTECALVRFEVIDNPADLCSDTIKPPLGPSFDDLVTYLAGLPTIAISENADVTVDGFRGKHLQYTMDGAVPEADVDCAFAGISIVAYDNVWILDVDGVHLLIASRADGDDPEGAEKIRQMVESIHLER
jgi:hypothetical protein